MIFAKLKGYLVAGFVALFAIIGVYLKGASDQNNRTKVRQKEVELKAYKASKKAEKKASKTTEENNEKADNGDFSGFNR